MPTVEQRRAAARRYGTLVDDVAQGYRNPYTGKPLSGAALLMKVDIGEGAGTSSAGAKGETQFMPATRQAVLKLTGGKVDPWRSLDEAYHAAALHLSGKLGNRPGLEGYNPGMPSYPSYILGQKVGRVGGGSGSSPSGGSGGAGALLTASAGGSAPGGMPQGSEGLVSLLAAMGEKPAPAASAGVAPPAFSAQAVLPAGAQMPVSGGGPAPKPDVNALLEAIRTPGGDVPQSQVEGASSTVALPGGGGGGSSGGGAGPGGRGKLTFAPQADVGVSRSILRVAEQVAAEHGAPLRVGTGKVGHSKYTASGNISDHSVGRGVDIPARGGQLTDLGRDALVALGVSPQKAAQMAKQGGIFNIPYGKKRRVQVIVNTDDHYDHLHLGVSPA